MANRGFSRLNSTDQIYHSPSPSQEFDLGSYPFQGQSRGRNPEYNDDYGNYMRSHQQETPGLGFTSPFAAGQSAYQPLGQYQEGEKRPLHQRTFTENSNRSRTSISSSTSKIISPLLTKPWHHARDKHGEIGTTRVFSKSSQARKTLIHGLVQCFPPAAFSACMALVLYTYDKRPFISHRDKYTFNALLLGFTLLLGFAVQSSFKLYADLMRWRFLASSHWDLKTFERIMGSSSQRTVLKLLWSGGRGHGFLPNRVQVVSFIYLFIAIGLQVVIACIGLCYTVETSQDVFAWSWGPTNISDLSYIKVEEPVEGMYDYQYLVLQTGAANTYGLISTTYEDLEEPKKDPMNFSPTIYRNQDSSLFWYNFSSNCNEPGCDLIRSTARHVTSEAICKQYEITNDGGYLMTTNVSWTSDDGSGRWVDFGRYMTGGTTTYVSDTDPTCGPRCATIVVLNTAPHDNSSVANPETVPQLFVCNNTISEMQNIDPRVDQERYSLPDEQARIFAGSIGYDGTYFTEHTLQFRLYPFGTRWSWDSQARNETYMASLVSRYSIGAISSFDNARTRTSIETFGNSPKRVLEVTVKWMWTTVVLVAVPGVQLLFLFYVMWFTRGVVIRDGSFLGNARLLRPIANELGDKGCALSGDDIADSLKDLKIAYGVRLPNQDAMQTGYSPGQVGPLMHLDIIQKGESHHSNLLNGWKPGMHMPEGRYDGYEGTAQVFESSLIRRKPVIE